MKLMGSPVCRLVIVPLALIGMSCASANPPGSPMPVVVSEEMQPLAPGDAIRINSWRETEMTGEYQIDATGKVVLPMLGSVEAADVDPIALQRTLMEAYSEQLRNPEIEITLLHRISILGGVTTPGLYLIDPTMRLADAVALAGGASGSGDIKKTRVLRDGVDVTGAVSMTAPLVNQLESGDQIFIPEKSWIERNGLVLLATLISSATILYAATIR